MFRKFLIKAFGLREVVEDQLKEELFPAPHYIRCCSGEEEKRTVQKKKDLHKKSE